MINLLNINYFYIIIKYINQYIIIIYYNILKNKIIDLLKFMNLIYMIIYNSKIKLKIFKFWKFVF